MGVFILPLTTDKAFDDLNRTPNQMINQGAVFRIVRNGDDYFRQGDFGRRHHSLCGRSRRNLRTSAVAKALASGRLNEVTQLYRHEKRTERRLLAEGAGMEFGV